MKVILATPVSRKNISLNSVPPLGLGYIAASLLKCGHDVSIVDSQRDRLGHEGFRRRIAAAAPDVLGFSVYSCDLESVREDSAWVRKNLPKTKIVAGGPHPTCAPGDFFTHFPDAHFGLAGEAELSLPKLLDFLEGKGKSDNIPGLIYQADGIIHANAAELIDDLSAFPLPAWNLLQPLSYPESPQGIFFKRLPTAPIITTRGCPFRCAFCAGPAISGSKVRRRPLADVISEIQFLITEYGIKEFHILDDNFTHGRNYAFDFCRAIMQNKIDIAWCCPNGIRLDTLDAELILLMKKSGCYSISVGIESGSQEILNSMNKGLRKETIREKVRWIKDCGLTANGFFILGFPGETEETIEETISFALSLPLDRASFFNFLPLPGTTATRRLADSGELKEVDYSSLYYIFTPYHPAAISERRLKALQRRAFLSFFLRPRIFFSTLMSIRTTKQAGFIIRRMVSYLK